MNTIFLRLKESYFLKKIISASWEHIAFCYQQQSVVLCFLFNEKICQITAQLLFFVSITNGFIFFLIYFLNIQRLRCALSALSNMQMLGKLTPVLQKPTPYWSISRHATQPKSVGVTFTQPWRSDSGRKWWGKGVTCSDCVVLIVFDIIMFKRPLFQTQYHHHDVQSLVDQSINNENWTTTKKASTQLQKP